MTALTQAELLFGLAAEDTPTVAVSEGTRAVLRGRRFFHCNNGPFCSVGVAGTEFDLTAEQLEQASPTMPCPGCGKILGAIEIVPIPPQVCWLCREPIAGTGKHAVSINPVSGVMALAHEHCATEAGGDKVTAMATARATHRFPDCRNCGRPYQEGHTHQLGSAWESFCDIEGERFYETRYRPAEPFRERGWPHRLIIDSPYYAENIYADESAEAAA